MLRSSAGLLRQWLDRNRIVRLLLATTIVSLPVLAQTAAPATDEEAILQAAREAREASRTYDISKLDELLAADFLAIDPAGQLRSKTEFIEMVRNLPPELKAANAQLKVAQRDVRLRQYGNVAVLTEVREVEESPKPSKARYTQVWVKEGGRWRLSTFQVTYVASPR
jgi:ketosteroid isomerase-like protein